MIPAQQHVGQPKNWQQCLREAITDPAELLEILDLDPHLLPVARRAATLFPLRVPRGFAARMQKGRLDDPLLRQVLPLAQELDDSPGYLDDAVGDGPAALAPGVIHKYAGRALLIATGACGVHCRFCFRRHFPYSSESLVRSRLPAAMDTLRHDASLREIILSGGDPLSLDNARLVELVRQLESVPHIKILRIHTRQPVVLPERIDKALITLFAKTRFRVVVVIHANHANEIDQTVASGLKRIRESGAILLNQSVLLNQVNDSIEALSVLSHKLLEVGVIPYYLHMPDRVRGTAHFDVDIEKAKELIDGLRRTLPGYLVPRLVREQAGQPYKLPIT
ncbi:MAG: EF-P beta-lysylation protein EpmB [Gammaproteobacteria bacterium]